MYTAYVLTEDVKQQLLSVFPPSYDTVVAHHITVQFGVDKDAPPPDKATIKVVGHVDSEDGLQVLVCSVNGTTSRGDGSLWHITWSLDDTKYKPVDSKALLKKKLYNLSVPIQIDTVPAVLG